MFTLVLMVLPHLSGCVHRCTEELSWHISPSEKTISIDESFKINADAESCGGKEKVHVDWFFKSENTDIAVVDSEGSVTGKSTGNTGIAVSIGEGEGTVGTSWIDVTVK